MGNHKSKESKQELNENGSRKLPTHHLPFQRKKKKIFATVKRIKNLFCKNTKKKKIVQNHNNKTSIHATCGLNSGIKTGNFTSYCSPYLLIQENIADDPLHDYWPPLNHSRLSLVNSTDEDQISKVDVEEDGILISRKSSLFDEAKNVAIQEIDLSASGTCKAKEIKLNQKTIPKLCNRSRSNSSNGTGDLLTCSSGSNDEFEDACSSFTDDIVMKNDISTAPTLEIICEEQLSQTSTLDVKICNEISRAIANPIVTRDLNTVKERIFHQDANEESLSNIQKTEKVEEQLKDIYEKIGSIEDMDLDEDLLKISKINKLSEANKIINDKLINLLEMNKEVLNNIADCNKKLIINKTKLPVNINDEAKLNNVATILETDKQFVEEFPVLAEENKKLHKRDESAISEQEDHFDTNQKSSSLSDKIKIIPHLKENEILSKSRTISEAPIATEESIIILDELQIHDQESKHEILSKSRTISEAPIATEESIIISDELQIHDQESKPEMAVTESEPIMPNEKSIKTDVSKNIIFNEPDQIYLQESKPEIIDESASIIVLKEKSNSKTYFSKTIIFNEPEQIYDQELEPEIIDKQEQFVLSDMSIKAASSKNQLITAMNEEGSALIDSKSGIAKNVENIIFDISKSISKPTIEDGVKLNEENSLDIIADADDIKQNIFDFSKIKNELEIEQSNNSFTEDLESKLLTENVTDVIVETSFNFSPEDATSSDGSPSSVMEIDDDVWEEEAPENLDEAPEQTAIDIKSKLVLDLLVQAEVDMEDFDAFIRLPYPLEEKYHLLQIQKMFDVHEINTNNLTELSRSLRLITKFGLDLLKPMNERPRHWKKILRPLETPSCHLLPVQDAQDILLEFGYQRFESGIIFLNEDVDAEAIAAWVVELLLAAYELSSFSRETHPQQQLFKQNFIKDEQSLLDLNGFENAENSPPLNLQVPDSPIIKESEEHPVNKVKKKKPDNFQDSDLNSEVVQSFSVEPSQRCHLCVSFASSIQCKQCLNLNFCISCDDAYHRHPKRKNHERQLMQRLNSPSSSPPSNFGNLQPIAPPRQRKSPTPNLPEYERAEFLSSPYPYLNHQQLVPQGLHGTNQFQQSPINCNNFMHQEVMLSNSTDERNEQPEDYNSFHLGGVDRNGTNSHNSSMDVHNRSLQTFPLSPQFGGRTSTITTLDPYYQQPQTRARHLRSMSGSFDHAEHSLTTDSPYFNNFQNKYLQSVSVADSPHYYTMCAPKPQVHSMLHEIDIANATLSCGCQFGVDEFGYWRPMTLCSTHRSQTVYLPIFANQSPKYLSYQNAAPLVPSLELTAPTINLVDDDTPTQSVKKRVKNKSQRSRKTQSNTKEEEKNKNFVAISKEQEVKNCKKAKQKILESYEMQTEADKMEPENSNSKDPTVVDVSTKECDRCLFYENSTCAICGKTNTLYQNPATVKNDDEVELTNDKHSQIRVCNYNLENKQQDQTENCNSAISNLELIQLEPIANTKSEKLEVGKKLQLTNDEIKNDDLESQQQVNRNKNVVPKTIDGELSKIKLLSNDPMKRTRKVEQNIKTNPKVENVGLIINKKWECEHCTYANDEVNAICAVCCKTKIKNSELDVVQPIVSQIINGEIENKPKVNFEKKYNVDQREQLKVEDKLKDEIKQNSENNERATKSITKINDEIINNSVSKSEEWECEHCTVINHINNTICSVCCKSKLTSLEKDNNCEPQPTLQKITPEKRKEDTLKKKQNVTPNGIFPKMSVEKELNEEIKTNTASLNSIVKDDPGDWECAHCSFINDINHTICSVCCKSKMPRLEEDNNYCQLQKPVPDRQCENILKEKRNVNSNETFTKLSGEEELHEETQMRTASLKVEKRNWECKHCSFINNYDSKICNVCCKTKTKKEKNKLGQSQLLPIIVSQSVNSLDVKHCVGLIKNSDLIEDKEKMITANPNSASCLQEADQPNECKKECSIIVGAVEKNHWECEHCTFINDNNNSKICAVCCKTNKINEALAEDAEEEAATKSQKINCQAEDKLGNCQNQQDLGNAGYLFEVKEKINSTFEKSKSNEESINSEDKNLLLSEPDKWECDHCTFVNDKNDKICNVCCKTKTLSTNLELTKNEETNESSSD